MTTIIIMFIFIFAVEIKAITADDMHSKGPTVKCLCFLLHKHVQEAMISLSVSLCVGPSDHLSVC